MGLGTTDAVEVRAWAANAGEKPTATFGPLLRFTAEEVVRSLASRIDALYVRVEVHDA